MSKHIKLCACVCACVCVRARVFVCLCVYQMPQDSERGPIVAD